MEGCISGMFLGAPASRRHGGPKARILPRFPILRWSCLRFAGRRRSQANGAFITRGDFHEQAGISNRGTSRLPMPCGSPRRCGYTDPRTGQPSACGWNACLPSWSRRRLFAGRRVSRVRECGHAWSRGFPRRSRPLPDRGRHGHLHCRPRYCAGRLLHGAGAGREQQRRQGVALFLPNPCFYCLIFTVKRHPALRSRLQSPRQMVRPTMVRTF